MTSSKATSPGSGETAGFGIRDFALSDGMIVAELHRAALPNGFLSTLGDPFLARLYLALSRHERSWVLVAEDDGGGVLGYVSGTTDTRACYRSVLVRHGLPLAARAASSIIDPHVARRVIETLAYPFRTRRGTEASSPASGRRDHPAELLSIAVSSEARGRGVGRALVADLEHRFHSQPGVDGYCVVTDAEDPRSNSFYVATGFESDGAFLHHGHPMMAYSKKLIRNRTSKDLERQSAH